MKVKDIADRALSVRPEEVRAQHEQARDLTYWYKNTIIVPKDRQKQIIMPAVREMEVWTPYGSKMVSI
jgi:hypothetical protein